MSTSYRTHHSELPLSSRGGGDMHDVTDAVAGVVADSGVREGLVNVFCPGSTGGVTTIEFEPGLRRDFPEAMERLVPREMRYEHDETWHDGNGHSHVRASLLGPSLSVPVSGGRPILGTWQQIIFMDFDVRSRKRRLIVTVLGEGS